MQLSHLEITNVRCVARCTLHPSAQLNVIWGWNASGKTTLLESIYLLGRARSFRSAYPAQLIRRGADELNVFAQLRTDDGQQIPVGVARSREGFVIRVAGRMLRQASELAAYLPLLFINKDSHQLLEKGASQRRRLLDWGVFHLDHGFASLWQRYQRALKQRNEALRQSAGWQSVSSWDRELARAAPEIHQRRTDYVQALIPWFSAQCRALLRSDAAALNYHPGWAADTDYAEVLQRAFDGDRAMGYTRFGPHRADMSLVLDGAPVAQHSSAGEQKLLLCALRLGQVALLHDRTAARSVILVDDLPAELDAANRKRLLEGLLNLNGQVFVTTTDLGHLEIDPGYTKKMFHVKQGSVNECETP